MLPDPIKDVAEAITNPAISRAEQILDSINDGGCDAAEQAGDLLDDVPGDLGDNPERRREGANKASDNLLGAVPCLVKIASEQASNDVDEAGQHIDDAAENTPERTPKCWQHYVAKPYHNREDCLENSHHEAQRATALSHRIPQALERIDKTIDGRLDLLYELSTGPLERPPNVIEQMELGEQEDDSSGSKHKRCRSHSRRSNTASSNRCSSCLSSGCTTSYEFSSNASPTHCSCAPCGELANALRSFSDLEKL